MKAWKESEYGEKLRDPRWQKKRLEILQRDEWTCQFCDDAATTLHIHHKWYLPDRDPWNYPDDCLITLCSRCHEQETEALAASARDLLHALKQAGADSDALSILAVAFEGPHDFAPARSYHDWGILAFGIYQLLRQRWECGPRWEELRRLSYTDEAWNGHLIMCGLRVPVEADKDDAGAEG